MAAPVPVVRSGAPGCGCRAGEAREAGIGLAISVGAAVARNGSGGTEPGRAVSRGAAGRAVSGRAVSGRAVSGRAVSGRAVSGRAVSGRAVSRGAAGRAVSRGAAAGRAGSGLTVSGRAAAAAARIRSSNDAGRAGGRRGRGCGTALAPGTRRGKPGESSGLAAGTGGFTAPWPSGLDGGGAGAAGGGAAGAGAGRRRGVGALLAPGTRRGNDGPRLSSPMPPTPTGARRDDAAPRTGQHMMTCGFNRNGVLC